MCSRRMTGAGVPRWVALWLGVVACPAAGQSTASLAGQLLDRATRQPLEGAAIRVLGTPVQLRTTANGRFEGAGFSAGVYVMQVQALGYTPGSWVLQLAEKETLTVVIELEPVPVALSTVTVEGQAWERRGLAGFTARREKGRGVYLTENDIKTSNATRLSDLLRSVSGVRLICRFNGCRVRMARGECQPDFFVDGYSANNSTSLEMPVVGMIAVEIYRTISETPVEFLRGNNTCGTIVIWTRSGL